MPRVILIFLLQAMALEALCGKEPLKNADDASNLAFRIWRVPPRFVATHKSPPGADRFKGEVGPNQQSTTKFLAEMGIPFPPGTFATYDPNSSVVVMRNTPENLDMGDFLLGNGCALGFASVNLEISTFECTFPPAQGEAHGALPKFSDLVHLPDDSLRLLDQATVLANGGVDADLHRTSRSQSAKESTSAPSEKGRKFADAEYGTIASISPVIGPDGKTVDKEISYKFRMPSPDNRASVFEYKGKFSSLKDRPAVIYSTPIPDTEGKTLVVVATARFITFPYDGSYEPLPSDDTTP